MLEEERKYCVYVHINKVNGKKYVGITKQKPEVRWAKGLGYKRGHRENRPFWNAIKKYTWDGFEHKILIHGLNGEQAEKWEVKLIKEYNSTDPKFGYNCETGGMLGKKLTTETRKKISEHHADVRREKHPMWGKHLSQETKDKIAEGNRGKKMSAESRAKMSALRKGRHLGAKSPTAKGVLCIETGAKYGSVREAERETGVRHDHISKCCHGKQITSGGYHWKFC